MPLIRLRDLAKLLGVPNSVTRYILQQKKIKYERTTVVDLDDVIKALGKDWEQIKDVVDKGGRWLRLRDYCKKYGISSTWGSFLWRLGALRGVRITPRIILVEDIPYEKCSHWGYSDEALLGKIAKDLQRHLTKPVAFVRISIQRLRWRPLSVLAKKGLLFRIGRFYYVLCDKMGRSLQEIKLVYPDPNEIIVPKLSRPVSWDDIVQVESLDITAGEGN